MEKYLIFLIIIIVVYYLFRYCIQLEVEKIIKTKEGFAGTTGGDADVASSINTLAQIAKDLQAGGLKVPGTLNVSGVINTDSDINAKDMKITKSLSLGDGKQDWGSVVSIRGGINDNGILEFKNKEDVRQCYLMGKPDGALFSQNLRVSGDLIVKDRNILAELDTLRTDVNKLTGSMRLFKNKPLANTWNAEVCDSNDNKYDGTTWVCCVQGVEITANDNIGTLKQFCYLKDNKWWVKSETNRGQTGVPVILAIRKTLFESVNVTG